MTDPMDTAHEVESALEDAIRLLKRRQVADDVTLEELKTINVRVPMLEAELARVRAEINAFLANQGALPAPTDGDFAAIRANAERLDNITARNLTTSAVLDLITQTVNRFRAG